MKKFLLSIMLSTGMIGAQAAESLIISGAPKTSPVTTMTMLYQQQIPDSKFYLGNNCADAVSRFEATPGSTFTYANTQALAGMRTGASCDLQFEPKHVYFYGEQHLKFCVKQGSTKNFTTPGVTFGAPSLWPVDNIVADINAQNGFSVRPAAFNASGAILAQVLSGDLDIGMIAKALADKQEKAGAIQCFASTEPAQANFLGRQIKMKKADLFIKIMILSKTADESLQQRFRAGIASKEFSDWVASSATQNVTTNATPQHIQAFRNYVADVHRIYIQK